MKPLRTSEEPSTTTAEQAENEEPTRREDLIRTAVDLFARNGYKGTSIRHIANTLQVSVSSIYHYFENKEGLWLAVLEHAIKGLPEQLRTIWQRELDPVARFQLLVKTHLAASGTHQKESQIFFIDEDQLSQNANEKNKAIQTKILDIYVQALEEMRSAGYVSTPEVKILAFNVLGVIYWYLRWFRSGGRLPAEAVHEEIANFVLHGVLGSDHRTGGVQR